MSQNKNKKSNTHKAIKERIFCENPYDIETFLEGFNIAFHNDVEYQFIDKFISHLRMDPTQDTADVTFKVLSKDLKLMEYDG